MGKIIKSLLRKMTGIEGADEEEFKQLFGQESYDKFFDGTNSADEDYNELLRTISRIKDAKEDNSISLNKRVDNIINWYKRNASKIESFSDLAMYYEPERFRNFIEKVAVWYELRYHDYDLDYELGFKQIDNEDSVTTYNCNMFENNEYAKENMSKKSLKGLDWPSLYNAHSFIKSLPGHEYAYFDAPEYPYVLKWENGNMYDDKANINAYVKLSKKGRVVESSNMKYICNNISDRKLVGMHIIDVINLLNANGVTITTKNSFVKAVEKYELQKQLKDKMLDAVMYRIIERGGNRVGPKRGFLFAKEFGRNIDVPMSYGLDFSDPYLNHFVNLYLKSGGNPDLDCYENYFMSMGDYRNINFVKVSDTFKTRRYTEEEKELAKRLVDLLASRVDYDLIRKEDAKKLRLEKKIRKSKIK